MGVTRMSRRFAARTLFAVMLFGIAVSTAAQQEGARRVAKRQSRRIEPAPTYLTQPFDPSTSNVGPRFNGHDIVALTKRVAESPALKPKSEFETSEQYDTRSQGFATSERLVGNVTPLSYLAFIVDDSSALSVRFEYDADKRRFTVHLNGRREKFYSDADYPEMDTVTVRSVPISQERYVAS